MCGDLSQDLPWASGKATWTVDSKTWRKRLRIPEDFAPYTTKAREQQVPLPRSKRELDLLDCVVVQAMANKKRKCTPRTTLDEISAALQTTFADLSQSHARQPFNSTDVARTLTTSSRLWCFAQHRFLRVEEHLSLQGYSRALSVPEGLKESEVRALAGEGIALPPLAMILWSVYLQGKL